MLYRLSYASKLRDRIFSDANLPTDPFQMTGTILKSTISGKLRASIALPAVHCTWNGGGPIRAFSALYALADHPSGFTGCYDRRLVVRLKRRIPVLLAVVLVAAAVFAVVQLRRRAPPEAARLLPGADGFFYVNLKWLRSLKAIGQLPPVPHDADYERFLQETDFQFERDLDEAAFAIHYPAKWGNGGTGGNAPEPRFSEVFIGKF